MLSRDPVENDLLSCLSVDRNHNGSELVGIPRTFEAWKTLQRGCCFQSALVETNPPVRGHTVVAFGASVFVDSEFARREIENPRPGLNARIIQSVAVGRSVVLDRREVAEGNAGTGLDLVVFCGCWLKPGLNHEQVLEAQTLLTARFLEQHTGFRIRMILCELIGEQEQQWVESAHMWRMVSDFEDFRLKYPSSDWPGKRRLVAITREEACSVAGSIMAILFHPQRPKLRLQEADQQLLQVALSGSTDQELARKLNLSLGAIKKRWLALFDRTGDRQPEMFAALGRTDSKRGPQKRNRILEYVRNHPEELKPYQWEEATASVQSAKAS